MKFSIITVVKDNVETIRDTIESILSQDYKNYEIIIIDGESTDGTYEIILEYKDKIKTLVSEKDTGIYYAMNKGLKYAKGDIVSFLNADDFFSNKKVLSSLVSVFRYKNYEIVFGDIVYVSSLKPIKIKRYWKSNFVTKKTFAIGHHPPHPGFFAKKKLYDELGFFNTNLPIVADFELMMRFMNHSNSYYYLNSILVVMRLGGASNKSIKGIISQNKLNLKVLKNYDNNINTIIFIISKIFIRGFQYIFGIFNQKKIKSSIVNFE